MHIAKMRRIFRIVESCLDVGADPESWRRTFVDGARDLFDAQIGLSGEFTDIYSDTGAVVHHHVDAGWETPEQQTHFIRYQIEGGHLRDPMRIAMTRKAARFAVASADTLVGIETFRASEVFRDYIEPTGLDDQMVGIHAYETPSGTRWQTLSVMRRRGDPLFSRDDRKDMFLLLREIRRHSGGGLADTHSPVARLTPRLREAFDALLGGAREKECAERLGVSSSTFHKYVSAIYRQFGVSGRAELQALFVRGFSPDKRAERADARAARLRREGAPMSGRWRAAESVMKQSR